MPHTIGRTQNHNCSDTQPRHTHIARTRSCKNGIINTHTQALRSDRMTIRVVKTPAANEAESEQQEASTDARKSIKWGSIPSAGAASMSRCRKFADCEQVANDFRCSRQFTTTAATTTSATTATVTTTTATLQCRYDDDYYHH